MKLYILHSFDNTHRSFVLSTGRKQQEAVHSAPGAPPPGLCNVQLDPLSVMAMKLETDIIYFASFTFWCEILACIFYVVGPLPCCQVLVQQVRPSV